MRVLPTSMTARGSVGALLLFEGRRSRRAIAGHAASSVLLRTGQLVTPLVLAAAIDDAVVPGDAGRGMLLGAVLLAATLVTATGEALEAITWARLRTGIEHRLRTDIARRALTLDRPFHERTPPGDTISRVTSDTLSVTYVYDAFSYGLIAVAAGVASVVVLATISPLLAGVTLAPVVAALLVSVFILPRYRGHAVHLQSARAEASMIIEDSISGARVTKGLGAEHGLGLRFQGISDRLLDRGLRIARLDASYRAALTVVPAAGGAALMLVGGQLAIDGTVQPGDLVAALAYLPLITSGLLTVATLGPTCQQGVASAARVVALLEEQRTLRTPRHPVRPTATTARPPQVRFDGVTAGPLRDLDLTVAAGATVAVVGATASGKSTLLALVARLHDPEAGTVQVAGVSVADVELAWLRMIVSLAPQPPSILRGTLRDNVGWMRPEASTADLDRAARLAGFDAVVDALPGGWMTRIGSQERALSGGQRQRLGLARTLLPATPVVLLDDVTSNLDARREALVADRLRFELAPRTALVVTRRRPLLELADEIVLLDRGRIADRGTFGELTQRSALLTSLLETADGVL